MIERKADKKRKKTTTEAHVNHLFDNLYRISNRGHPSGHPSVTSTPQSLSGAWVPFIQRGNPPNKGYV